MKKPIIFAAVAFAAGLFGSAAFAAPCMTVTLTGTQGGPPIFKGQAGAGTLVQYGDDENNCGAVKLQFDTGRGTTLRLSQLRVPVGKLNAIFYTHMHSDHTERSRQHASAALALRIEGPQGRHRLQ